MEKKQAIVIRVRVATGPEYSRVWCRTADAEFNFDIPHASDARNYQVGMTILINIENGRATPSDQAGCKLRHQLVGYFIRQLEAIVMNGAACCRSTRGR